MPELAEVERAKNDCKLATEGKIISEIQTREDNRVFQGCTHKEFGDALRGKRVASVGRLGKYFYVSRPVWRFDKLVMQTAPHVVMHLGMAGFVSTKGQEPLFYRKKAKNKTNEEGTDWPLRYWKFALKMQDGTEWCFCDSRRFGRISLVHSGDDKGILDVEPLSLLGRDPYLDMPSVEELSASLLKRKAPIKAVLLDQNGPLCGIGNWLVDEILFQAAIHPAQRSNTLTSAQLAELHKQITTVINTAVAVNADHKKFPTNWLFKYRWGKGRRNEPATFTLPDGTLATVIHQTVGGRTSAIVESVQKLLGEVASDVEDELGSEEGVKDEEEEEVVVKKPVKRTRKSKAKPSVNTEVPDAPAPAKRGRRKAVKKENAEDVEEVKAAVLDDATEEKAVKITARKRKASVEPANGKRRQKVEVKIEPVSPRATRASARQSRS